jgi:integrase
MRRYRKVKFSIATSFIEHRIFEVKRFEDISNCFSGPIKYVIALKVDDELESRSLAPTSIRRKLSALSSLFDYLCERNAVLGNPMDGVKRPASNNNEGSTPALGDAQVRRLLEAPPLDTLKGVRDGAILAALLYHGIPPRGTMQIVPARSAESPGCHALPRIWEARKDQVCSRSPMACGLLASTSKWGNTAGR